MNPRAYMLKSGAVSALALFFVLPAAFAGGPGSAGLQVLKSDISPRAMGMGGAFTAIADDAYSMNYNPAGLGQLYMPEVSAMYLSGFEESKLQNFSAAMPLPLTGFAGLTKPSVGVSVMMADAGSFIQRVEDPVTWQVLESRSLDAQKDMVVILGYGEKVYSEDVKVHNFGFQMDQYVGFNAKYIKSTMLENYSASAFAFDAGWLAMAPKLGVSVAASFSNLGSGLKYVSETTQLPAILRLGVSYQRPTVMDQSVLLAAEGDFYTAESQKSLRLGMEYHFESIFNLRIGYKTAEDNGGLTLGLGVRYGDAAIDFATTAGGAVYNTSQLAFSYKFSGVVVNEHRKKMIYKDAEPRKKEQPAPAKTQRKTDSRKEKKNNSDFFWLY